MSLRLIPSTFVETTGYWCVFDNYGNYVPGFCAGVTLGDCRKLDELLREGVDTARFPVLGLLMEEDLKGLLALAGERGYQESAEGFYSKCHLCTDLRKRLFGKQHLVLAAGIGLRPVALGDFLRGLGVVFVGRPHANGKRAQRGPRGQRWL